MGYRSDAQLIFYCQEDDPNYPLLKLWVTENMQDELACMEEFTSQGCKGFTFNWSNVKWYPDYEDIKKIEDAMVRFVKVFDGGSTPTYVKREEGTPKFEYEFVRIGEEDDDIEVKSSRNSEYLIGVRRSIEWN